MRPNLLVKFLIILVGLTLLSNCTKYGTVVTGSVDNITVGLAVKPAKPTTGDNQFKVLLTDAGGPIQDAAVTVSYFMPAMGSSMPVMQGSAPAAASAPGEYVATLNLPMEGNWTITIMAGIPSKQTVRVQFRIMTGSSRLLFQGE